MNQPTTTDLFVERLTPLLKTVAQRFASVRLFDEMTYAQEKAYLMQLIEREPKTRLCTPESLASALLQSASVGLSLNPLRKHVYIIPRKLRKRKPNETDAEYDKVPMIAYASPSYIGLIHLAVTGGAVRQVAAEVVFADDAFAYHGPMEKVVHTASLRASQREHKHAIGVYAMALMASGDYAATYLDNEQIRRIASLSEFPNSTIWNPGGLWTEGWKKAAIRRLWKTLPMSPAMQAADAHLNTFEGITPDDRETLPAPLLCSETQLAEFAHELAKLPEGKRGKWEQRLAAKYGVPQLQSLPASLFEEAIMTVKSAVARVLESPAASDAPR